MKNTLKSKTAIGVILGIILIGANLRAPLTSVGPVLNEITNSLKINNVLAGMVTTIPLIAFAVLSGFIPKVSKIVGAELFLFISILLLIIGLFIRPLGSVFSLFAGAGLIGCAITIGNVLVPAYVKSNFPAKAGLVTGLYSASMNLTAALAAGFSIKLGEITGMGWRGSIGIWVFLAIITAIAWFPQIKRNKKAKNVSTQQPTHTSVWKSGLAWCIASFMGLQSIIFYCLAAWIPTILKDWGMDAEKSGWVLSYIQLAMLPVTFLAPIIIGRTKNQLPLVIITSGLMLAGISGIIIGKTQWVIPSVIFIGLAGGLAFCLAMMFFILRSKNHYQAVELSGMSQAIGYLFAACGPPLFGAIHDSTSDWNNSLLFLIICSVLLLITGLISGKNRFV